MSSFWKFELSFSFCLNFLQPWPYSLCLTLDLTETVAAYSDFRNTSLSGFIPPELAGLSYLERLYVTKELLVPFIA